MKFISHRGNLTGPNLERENSPDYILEALNKNYDVEIDVRIINDKIYLGHDHPQYEININFLLNNTSKLWCHCKNVEAMTLLHNNNLHCFSHDKDPFVFTNQGIIWAYPSVTHITNAISVLPEWYTDKLNPYTEFKNDEKHLGLCSDYVEFYYLNQNI